MAWTVVKRADNLIDGVPHHCEPFALPPYVSQGVPEGRTKNRPERAQTRQCVDLNVTKASFVFAAQKKKELPFRVPRLPKTYDCFLLAKRETQHRSR